MPEEPGVAIRAARASDATAIAALAGELGYPVTTDAIRDRLARLAATPATDAVFVAVGAEDTPIGWLHVGIREALEHGRRGEILGLVVAGTARGGGIGRALVAAAERWVADRGETEVTVRSNAARTASHPFYLRLGYERVKTSEVYRRSVDPGSRG